VGRNSATATVTVNIMDVNNNAPAFSKDVYYQDVGELAIVGSTLVTVEATDADRGINKGVSTIFSENLRLYRLFKPKFNPKPFYVNSLSIFACLGI